MIRLFVPLLMVAALIASGCDKANQRVHRIGILCGGDAFTVAIDGFKKGMAEEGYREGETVVYEVRMGKSDRIRQSEIVRTFVSEKVDLIFAFPTGAALAAKEGTAGTAIPVLFSIANTEGTKLVDSVRAPGMNITGVRLEVADVVVKRLELLLQMAPKVRQVLLLHDPDYPASVQSLAALKAAAAPLGVRTTVIPLTSADSAQSVTARLDRLLNKEGSGRTAIINLPTEVTNDRSIWDGVSAFASRHRLPLVGGAPWQVRQGALFTYTGSHVEACRLAAPLAVKILTGTQAGSIPVVTAEPELRLNAGVARKLGLTITDGIIKMATEVVR